MQSDDKHLEFAINDMVRATEASAVLRPQYLEMHGLEVLLQMVAEGKARRGPLDPWGSPTFQLQTKWQDEFVERLWDEF